MPINSVKPDAATQVRINDYQVFTRLQKLMLVDLPAAKEQLDKLNAAIPELQVSEDELRADYESAQEDEYRKRKARLKLVCEQFRSGLVKIALNAKFADLSALQTELDGINDPETMNYLRAERINAFAKDMADDQLERVLNAFGTETLFKPSDFLQDFAGCRTFADGFKRYKQLLDELEKYYAEGRMYDYIAKYQPEALRECRKNLEKQKQKDLSPAIIKSLPDAVLSDFAEVQSKLASVCDELIDIKAEIHRISDAGKQPIHDLSRDVTHLAEKYYASIPAPIVQNYKQDQKALAGNGIGIGVVALGIVTAVVFTNPIGLSIATAAVVLGGVAIIAATIVLNRRSNKSAFQKVAAFFTRKPAAPVVQPAADDASLASALSEADRAERDADVESVASDVADLRSLHDDDVESIAAGNSEDLTDYAAASGVLPAVDADAKSFDSEVRELADQFFYLAPEFKVAGNDKQFRLREVYGDGDCGYLALGTTRKDSYQLLNANAARIASAIKPIIIQELAGEKFRNWLLAQNDLPQGLLNEVGVRAVAEIRADIESSERKLDGWVDEPNAALVKAYLKYDVELKLTEGGGYAHPVILQQLAHLKNKKLRIWGKNAEGELVLSPDYSDNVTNEATALDILFVNNNHFDGLENTSPVRASVASFEEHFGNDDAFGVDMPPVDKLVLTDEMKLLADELESNKGSAAGAVARDTTRRAAHIPVDDDSDSDSDEQEAAPVALALQRFSQRMASRSFTSTSSSSSFWSKSPLHKDRDSDADKPARDKSLTQDAAAKK